MSWVRGKQVAIIGAGPAGLVSARHAIDCGLQPTIFEKADRIGGVFRGSSASEPGLAWDGMRTNVSIFSMHFHGLWPKRSSIYPFCYQHEVYEYLCEYVRQYGIEPHLQFCVTVESTKRFLTAEGVWKWRITTRTSDGNYHEAIFDFLIIASGRNGKPFISKLRNESLFSGKVYHCADYSKLSEKSDEAFGGKRVVVIGAGTSGGDMVPLIARHAQQVFHLLRRMPYWIRRVIPVKKYGTDNEYNLRPWDIAQRSRSKRLDSSNELKFRTPEQNEILHQLLASNAENQFQIERFKRELIDRSKPPFVVRNDTYLEALQDESLNYKIRPIIGDSAVEFFSGGLVLESGRRIECDVVFYCTGYSTNVDFLDEDILRTLEYDGDDSYLEFILYKLMYRPEISNLAFVSIVKNSPWSIAELQARWAAMMFSGRVAYPDDQVVQAALEEERRIRLIKPRKQLAHDDIAGLADSIAVEFGALPDFERIKTEDPNLYKLLWHGPVIIENYFLEDSTSVPLMEMTFKYGYE